MDMTAALREADLVFLDTAPVVYYVEADARYLAQVDPVSDRIDAAQVS